MITYERFIRIKTRGTNERFKSDEAQTAIILNCLKNDPLYTHLVMLLA